MSTRPIPQSHRSAKLSITFGLPELSEQVTWHAGDRLDLAAGRAFRVHTKWEILDWLSKKEQVRPAPITRLPVKREGLCTHKHLYALLSYKSRSTPNTPPTSKKSSG